MTQRGCEARRHPIALIPIGLAVEAVDDLAKGGLTDEGEVHVGDVLVPLRAVGFHTCRHWLVSFTEFRQLVLGEHLSPTASCWEISMCPEH